MTPTSPKTSVTSSSYEMRRLKGLMSPFYSDLDNN